MLLIHTAPRPAPLLDIRWTFHARALPGNRSRDHSDTSPHGGVKRARLDAPVDACRHYCRRAPHRTVGRPIRRAQTGIVIGQVLPDLDSVTSEIDLPRPHTWLANRAAGDVVGLGGAAHRPPVPLADASHRCRLLGEEPGHLPTALRLGCTRTRQFPTEAPQKTSLHDSPG